MCKAAIQWRTNKNPEIIEGKISDKKTNKESKLEWNNKLFLCVDDMTMCKKILGETFYFFLFNIVLMLFFIIPSIFIFHNLLTYFFPFLKHLLFLNNLCYVIFYFYSTIQLYCIFSCFWLCILLVLGFSIHFH